MRRTAGRLAVRVSPAAISATFHRRAAASQIVGGATASATLPLSIQSAGVSRIATVGVAPVGARRWCSDTADRVAASPLQRAWDDVAALSAQGQLGPALHALETLYKDAVKLHTAASVEAVTVATGVGRTLLQLGRPSDAAAWMRSTVTPHRDVAALSKVDGQPATVFGRHPVATAVDADRVVVSASIHLGDRRTAVELLTLRTIPLLQAAVDASANCVPSQQQVLDDMRCGAASAYVGLATTASEADAAECGEKGLQMLRDVVASQQSRAAEVPIGVRFRAKETLWQAIGDVQGADAAVAAVEEAIAAAAGSPVDVVLANCAKVSVLLRHGRWDAITDVVPNAAAGAVNAAAEAALTAAGVAVTEFNVAVECAAETLEALLEHASSVRSADVPVAFARAAERLALAVAERRLEETKLPESSLGDQVIRVRVCLATALHNQQTPEGYAECVAVLREKLLAQVRHPRAPDDPTAGFRSYILLGMCETARGNGEAAVDALQTAVAIARSGFGPEHRGTASAAHQLARALGRHGNAQGALSLIKNAVRPVYAAQPEGPQRSQLLEVLDADEARIRTEAGAEKAAELEDAALPSMSVDDALLEATPTPALLQLQRQVGERLQAGDAAGAREILERKIFPKAMQALSPRSAARWLELARAVSALARIDGAAAAAKSQDVTDAFRRVAASADLADGFIDAHNAAPRNVRLMLETQNALLQIAHGADSADVRAAVRTHVLGCIDKEFDAGATLPADDCIALLYQLSSVVAQRAAKLAAARHQQKKTTASDGEDPVPESIAGVSAEEDTKLLGLELIERLAAISGTRRGPAARESLMLRITAATEQMTVRGDAERALKELSEAAVDATSAHGPTSIEVLVAKLRMATVLAAAGALQQAAGLLQHDVVPSLDQLHKELPATAPEAPTERQTFELVSDSRRAATTLLQRVNAAVATPPPSDETS